MCLVCCAEVRYVHIYVYIVSSGGGGGAGGLMVP